MIDWLIVDLLSIFYFNFFKRFDHVNQVINRSICYCPKLNTSTLHWLTSQVMTDWVVCHHCRVVQNVRYLSRVTSTLQDLSFFWKHSVSLNSNLIRIFILIFVKFVRNTDEAQSKWTNVILLFTAKTTDGVRRNGRNARGRSGRG